MALTRSDIAQVIFQHPECLPQTYLAPNLGTPVPVCRNLTTPEGTIDVLMLGARGELVVLGAPEAAEALCELDYYGLEDAVADACNDRRLLSARMGDQAAIDADLFVRAVDLNLDLGRILVVTIGEPPPDGGPRIASSVVRLAGTNGAPLLIWPEPVVSKCRPLIGSGKRRERLYGVLEAQAFALPAQLQYFLRTLEPFDIVPWFGRSLGLVWLASTGPVVLARISAAGHVSTDVEAATLSVSANALARRYVRTLAAGVGCCAVPTGDVFSLRTQAGKPPRLCDLAPHFDTWGAALGAFVTALRGVAV